jgi:hypothetical protein
MKEIYVVFDGDYSDREAIAAFTDQQAAKRAVEQGLGDEFETLAVDPILPEHPVGKKFWTVYFRHRSI